MLEFEIKINGRGVIKGNAHQIGEIKGTETWRQYDWRIWEALPAVGEDADIYAGQVEGELDHNRTDGAGILVAKVLEAAYGKDTV